jgi:hypothetical protein
MKGGKTKTRRRRTAAENGSAPAPVSKTAKTKPKKRLDERASWTTLKSRMVSEERLATILYGWPAEEAVGRIARELLATEFPVPLSEIQSELLDTGVW